MKTTETTQIDTDVDDDVGHDDLTRSEHDVLEATTLKALPIPRVICWEGVIARDEFYEDITDVTSQAQIKWRSLTRRPGTRRGSETRR